MTTHVRDAGNFDKIWSACGQHKIQHTKWRMYKYTYTCCKIETFIKKWNLQPRLECHSFKNIFTKWNINVIEVSINKQITSFKNCLAFFLGFARERNKWRLFTSNVCASNILPTSYGLRGLAVESYLHCSCLLPLPTFANYITRSGWW
jgi:hypothetical protein